MLVIRGAYIRGGLYSGFYSIYIIHAKVSLYLHHQNEENQEDNESCWKSQILHNFLLILSNIRLSKFRLKIHTDSNFTSVSILAASLT